MLVTVVAHVALPAFVKQAQAQDESATQWPDILQDGVLNTQARLWFYDGEKPILIPSGSLEEILSLRNEFGGDEVGVLPNWSYSQFDLKIDASQPTANNGSGSAAATLDIAVETGPREALATVPLRLESLRLTKEPKQDLTGRSILRPSTAGFEWLLAVQPDSVAKLSLEGRTAVKSDGERFALRLSLPMAVCRLQVQLPNGASDIRVSNDDVMETQRNDDETTVSLTSSGGTVEITWRAGTQRAAVTAVEANSISTFSVREPAGIWTVETSMNLQWSGPNSTPKVNILLPPGARFRSPPSYNFDEQVQVSRLPAVGETPERLVVENFAPEQTQSVDVQFEWELSAELAESSELSSRLDMPRLQVNGADSHRGRFELLYPSQYTTSILRADGTTLLQQSRTEETGRRLSFGFDSDDFALRLVFRREQSLPVVRPTYNLHADASKLTLTTWLDCSFDPNQLSHELGFSLADWSLEDNAAFEIMAFGEVNQSQQVILVRPTAGAADEYTLLGPDPEAGSFNSGQRERKLWKIVAYRAWTPGEKINLRLPEIVLGKLDGRDIRGAGAGVLIVSSAENILLNGVTGEGLLADTYSPLYLPYLNSSSDQWRAPSVFRFQSQGEPPSLQADSVRLERQVVATEEIDVVLLPSQVEIRQQFELNIANDPLQELLFAVHETPDSFQPPQVYIDGNLIAAEPVSRVDASEIADAFEQATGPETDEPGADTTTSTSDEASTPRADSNGKFDDLPPGMWTVYRLVAPPRMIGQSNVEISTGIRWTQETDFGQEVGVPLVALHLPAPTRTLRRQATLQDTVDSRATWRESNTNTAATPHQPETSYAILESTFELQLATQPQSIEQSVQGRIDIAWLQTAITNLHRRDRFCFQYIGNETSLAISLPRFVDDLQVVIDGQTSEDFAYDNAENLLLVNLPDTRIAESAATGPQKEPKHVVEVSYFQQENVAWLRSLDMKCPTVESIGRVGRFYWQLVTPGAQHLASPPTTLTPEWRWVWDGFSWRRESADVDFEQLLGTSKQASLAQSMNRYSMSGSEIRPAQVWLLSRFALWFPVGLLAILTSFAILNYRVFRHPLAMLVYAVVLAGFALLTPGFAMLVTQTSLVALVLVFLLWATQVAVESRVRRRSVFSGHSLSTLESMPGFGSNISNTLAANSGRTPSLKRPDESNLENNGNTTTIGASGASADEGD